MQQYWAKESDVSDVLIKFWKLVCDVAASSATESPLWTLKKKEKERSDEGII